jgi:hypothetical protein
MLHLKRNADAVQYAEIAVVDKIRIYIYATHPGQLV